MSTYLITRSCLNCGKTFSPHPTNVKRGGGIYCSLSCAFAGQRSQRNWVARFWEQVDKTDTCWLWTGKSRVRGYGYAYTGPRGGARSRAVAHRVAWELTNGPIPDGLFVCHKCDVRLCVNPAHLFLGTHQDNMTDGMLKGRMGGHLRARGSAVGTSKLNDDDVRAIRSMYATERFTYKEIAEIFSVTTGNVAHIVRRVSWRHIE